MWFCQLVNLDLWHETVRPQQADIITEQITPIISEAVVGENAEGDEVQPPERSFWAKYWMYLIPLGLIVMNAMTQAMNMAEEQTSGQAGAQGQQAIGAQRAQNTVVRRR
ncbi:hypothetical protein MTR67_018501 [Solanum verrucosum]|uniref:ER membrane protein complex subunit 10 n=1 Tax=Solanum verrucosum TaxID=315347 RepID=A0AAF0TMF9_SOLVR|nr:hypothetical protein MTR67_018501 [Solanum verrucosum]